jgi:GTPase SAR1 family protein
MEELKVTALIDTKEDHQFDFLPPPLPHIPARILAIGSSASGKTNLIMSLITKFWLYPNSESIFDEIYVLTPTARQDPIFKLFATNPNFNRKTFLTDILDLDLINELLNRNPDGRQICVFLDDFGATINQRKNDISKVIYDLYFRGRHNSISSVINSQYFFTIPAPVRTNATALFLFNLKRANELQLLRNELSTSKIKGELFDEVFEKAHKDRYDFLYINTQTGKFYRNFETEFVGVEDDKPEEKKEEKDIEEKQIDEEIKKEIENSTLNKNSS